MSHTLAYGDIIRIYCSLQDNKDGNKTGGFLMSKGFADTNIYFLKSNKFTQFQLRNSLFEVLPYSSFQIHDEAKKKKQQAKQNNQKPEINENIQSSMKTEQQQFKSKITKQRKMDINFDSQVVIKHVNSDAYLQGQFSCPETGIGSFKLILSSQLSSDVKFKITRFRNSDKQAQKIQSKDQFILYHCTSHCYLNIGDLEQKVFLDKQIKVGLVNLNPIQIARQDKQSHLIINQRPLIKRPSVKQSKGDITNLSIQRYEVVNMSKPTLVLNFLLQKSSKQQCLQSEISHNDVIYIKNTQNKSYLTANLWSGEVSLISYTGQKSGNFPYQGLWQVCVPRDPEKGQLSNSKSYFLKHYITDKLCRVDTYNSKLRKIQLHNQMMFNVNMNTFKLATYQDQKKLKNRDLVFLEVCNSKTEAIEKQQFQYLDIGQKSENIFRTKLEQKIQQNSTTYNLNITKGPLTNAFQIFKFESNKLKQINKILSCVQILTNFCDVLLVLDSQIRKKIRFGEKQKPPEMQRYDSEHIKSSTFTTFNKKERLINKNRTSLQQINYQVSNENSNVEKFINEYLNYYILNLVIKTIQYLLQNVKKTSKKPDFPFMMMIRSLGLIQILIQAVFFIEKNQQLIRKGQICSISDYLKKKKYLRDRLEDCFRLIYNLFFQLSQQNSCRLYLGKWFGMFMTQFYSLRSDFIHVLIISLLKQKFIIKIMKTLDIQKCIQNMTSKQIMNSAKSYKYLQLLSSFCRTKTTAISQNQKFIMNKLKDYPDLFYIFNSQDISRQLDSSEALYGQRNQIYYKKKTEEGLLQNFQDDEKWSYIIYLLNLYADLIYDYPYKKIGLIKKFINLQTVKAFFQKKDIYEKKGLDVNIVDSFLKLTHYFFLNQLEQSPFPIHKIDRQQILYIVQNTENQECEIIKKQSNSQYQKQKNNHQQIIKNYNDILKFITDQILEKHNNQIGYQVSKLKTIQTGLDFIKAISKVQNNALITKALKLIIQAVIQLKRTQIYVGTQKSMKNLFEIKQKQQILIDKDDAILQVDKAMSKNIKKLLSFKPLERLLIDTRSVAGQILQIQINILINKALQQLNIFFTEVCENQIHLEHYNRARNSEILTFGQNSHWIWINKIIQIVNQRINGEINNLMFQKKCKTSLVKLLIECIFVDSLKIVNKIMMLIFKMYQLRKSLMYRFKDTFIITRCSFQQMYQFNITWISNFEKIKIDESFETLMTDLQVVSMVLRYYNDQNKLKKLNELYHVRQQKDYQNKKILLLSQLTKGLSKFLVLNQTNTCLSINQVLLQKMIGNQKIHTYVISYIKNLKQNSPHYNQHLDIAYQFLTLLVYNNRKNKKILTKHLLVILNHIGSNYRAIEFLKKTIVENQNVINNKQLVTKIVTKILQTAHSLDGDEQKIIIKAKLIQCLRVFCVLEGKNHVQNQSLIMIQLQNKKYEDSLMFSTIQYHRYKNLSEQRTDIFKQIIKMGTENHLLKAIGNNNRIHDSQYQSSEQEIQQKKDNFKRSPLILKDFENFRKQFSKIIEKKQNQLSGYMDYQSNQCVFLMQEDQQIVMIQIPGSLLYLSAYFSTMAALVQGGHQINKGKCCNMHPYDSLVDLIQDAYKCYPVLRFVRSYLIKLNFYNFMDKKIPQKTSMTTKIKQSTIGGQKSSISFTRQNIKDFESILSKLLTKQINLIADRLKSLNKQLLDEQNCTFKIVITTPIRYKYMQSYMLCLLQELLYQVNIFFEKISQYVTSEKQQIIRKQKTITKQQFNLIKQLLKILGTTYQLIMKSNKDSTLKKLIKNIFRKSMNIVKIVDTQQQSFLKHVEIEKIDQSIKQSQQFQLLRPASFQKKYSYEFMVYYFFLTYEQQKGILPVNSQIQYQNKNIVKSSQQNIKKSYIRRLIPNSNISKESTSQLFSKNKVENIIQQLENSSKQIRINKLLEIITNDLAEQQQSQIMIRQELDDLVTLCSNLDQVQNQKYGNKNNDYRVIGYNKFMKSIIQLVTKNPAHLTLDVKIKTIKLIRMIFEHKVNTSCHIKIKEWDTSLFQGDKLKILQQIQNKFKDLELNKMIVSILRQQTTSFEFLLETFKLGINFLYNGNSKCQTALLNNLREDSQNLVMVELFNFIKKMRSQISQGKFIIKKQQKQKQLKKIDISQSIIIDTFHYFDKNNQCMEQLGAEKDTSKQFELEVEIKIKCVCKAYQFLQLLCQNDNQSAKNFLRQQTNLNGYIKYNSINFVSQTGKLFKVVLQNFDPQQKQNSILQYLADFFIEVTQLPCTQNQLQLCSTSIFSDIRYYAISSSEGDLSKQGSNLTKQYKSGNIHKSNNKFNQIAGAQKPMCYLMDFVINASLSLLQGSSNQIYKALINFLDKQFIYEIFRYQRQVLIVLNKINPQCPLIHQFNDNTLKILLTKDPENALIRKRIYMIYNLFALIQKLSRYTRQNKYYNDQGRQLIQKLQQYAKQKDKHYHHQEGDRQEYQPSCKTISQFRKKIKHIEVVFQQKKQYLYFPDLPIFKKVSNETKQQILENINRETQIDKITGFLMKSPEINNLMNWNYKVEDRSSLGTQTLQTIRFNILSLTLIIVGLYIAFTTVTFVSLKGRPHMIKTIENPLIHTIVKMLSVFHLFSSMYFVFTWCTLKYRMPIEKQFKENESSEIAKLLQKIDTDSKFENIDYYKCLFFMLKNQNQIYSILLFFVVFSFLGCFVGIQWYSLIIFDMVTRNKILKNVIQAITQNLQQLFVVSLLILAFVYVFNIISIQFSLYLPLVYEQQEQKCTVLSDCLISLYTSGEIGQKHKDFKFVKFLADLLYIVIMQLLFSNIVSGIVIDTFAQLRDSRKTIQTDNQTTCFICGISKEVLQKQVRQQQDFNTEYKSGIKRFQKHIQEVHSQWDYIYYLYILSQKDITTYSGIEYFIKKQYNNDQYDWVPTYKKQDDQQIKQILQRTQKLVPKIKDKLQSREINN